MSLTRAMASPPWGHVKARASCPVFCHIVQLDEIIWWGFFGLIGSLVLLVLVLLVMVLLVLVLLVLVLLVLVLLVVSCELGMVQSATSCLYCCMTFALVIDWAKVRPKLVAALVVTVSLIILELSSCMFGWMASLVVGCEMLALVLALLAYD